MCWYVSKVSGLGNVLKINIEYLHRVSIILISTISHIHMSDKLMCLNGVNAFLNCVIVLLILTNNVTILWPSIEWSPNCPIMTKIGITVNQISVPLLVSSNQSYRWLILCCQKVKRATSLMFATPTKFMKFRSRASQNHVRVFYQTGSMLLCDISTKDSSCLIG